MFILNHTKNITTILKLKKFNEMLHKNYFFNFSYNPLNDLNKYI